MYAALMDLSQSLAASLAYAPLYTSSASVAAAAAATAASVALNGSQVSNFTQLDGSAAAAAAAVAVATTAAVHNVSEEDDYVRPMDRPETYLVIVLFTLIFIVGVLGNGTLVIIFFRHRSMRNIPNT